MAQGTTESPNSMSLAPEASKLLDGEAQPAEDEMGNVTIRYPKGVFFIIVSTFFERFNFNGIRAVLPLYIRNILLYNEDQSTVIFHALSIVCFLFPILGGVISDSYLGNFKTITYFSIFYTIGSVLLPLAAIPDFLPQTALSLIALFIIHVGTGGMKPCVTAFGGEQFSCPQQSKELDTFFSCFYITLNAGALVAVFVTPIMRDDVKCFGESSCFPLAFGANAVFMLLSLVIFLFGKRFYITKRPHQSIITQFCACVWRGFKRKLTVKNEKHDHWLDYALDKFDKQLIEDAKQVLSVVVLFIPLPAFWALYDQQNTRWTFQATRMNGELGGWVIKPEQMQIINPILTILFVPLFDRIIYPMFKKWGLLTPLQRIGSGIVFCGIAFVISALVEITLEPTYARVPPDGLMKLNFINTLPCNVDIRYAVGGPSANMTLDPNQLITVENLLAEETITILHAIAEGEKCTLNGKYLNDIDLGRGNQKASYSVLITHINNELAIARMNKEEQIEKSFSGDPLVGFFNLLDDSMPKEGVISLRQNKAEVDYIYNETSDATPAYVNNVVQTDYQEVEIRDHEVYLSGYNDSIGRVENLMQGGVYRVIVFPSFTDPAAQTVMTVQLTPPNTISIFWLLPQIIVMVVAEILFAVTQMTFSFTEAPARMKSVMQAISLLIIAVGNLIVIIVAEAKSGLSQRDEFFLFAGISGLAAVAFAFIGMRYEYFKQETEEGKTDPLEKQSKKK